MNAEEFDRFYEALIHAECVKMHDFELKVFEGCMPIEEWHAAVRKRCCLVR